MQWSELYTRQQRPGMAEIRAYLRPEVRPLFVELNSRLKQQYALGYVLPAYSESLGWKYQYGHSGLILVRNVCFQDGLFTVEGIAVTDRARLEEALAKVDALYRDGFQERFAEFAAKRSARTKARTERRALVAPPPDPDADRCVWPAKVSRRDLERLYASDARRLLDEELLEEIGLTLVVRCTLAKEIWDLMDAGKIKCLHCGAVLQAPDPILCPCGQRYTYRGYRQSYRANDMPRGAASDIFDVFVAQWEQAGSATTKMRLVDGLIHECHVSLRSGTRGRPVGINLIQGTRAQVAQMINTLAYGDSSV